MRVQICLLGLFHAESFYVSPPDKLVNTQSAETALSPATMLSDAQLCTEYELNKSE